MSKLLFQHNPNLHPQINKTGCNLIDLLTIAQLKSRYVFDAKEVNELFEILKSKKFVRENCAVVNAEGVILSAFEYLGITDGYAEWVNAGYDKRVYVRDWDPRSITFTILDYGTSANPNSEYGGHHFMLGNAYGDKIFDPDYPRSNRYVKRFNNWRLWRVRCTPLTDRQIKRLKDSKGLAVQVIDYTPMTGRTDGDKIVEKTIEDTIPDTPVELVIHDGYIEASGGIIDYVMKNGGTVELTL